MIRMPDALESSIQKATDLGAIGIIVPTVDDALEARDAARFSRYPPFGRRSSGGGSFGQVVARRELSRDGQRQHARDRHDRNARGCGERRGNRRHARRRRLCSWATTISRASQGWAQNDPRYQDAVIKVHDAALKYGKYFGNAGAQYLNGYVLSADTRMVQNGPARDGWTPPRAAAAPVAARHPLVAAAATTHPSPMRSQSSGSRAAASRGTACAASSPR